MNISVTLDFTGQLPPECFREFAAHRAARLSLGHEILEQTPGRAVIRLTGPEALVDAFEMALSLGPAECLVHEVRTLDNRGAA